MLLLNKAFSIEKKAKTEVDMLRLPHKDEWDIVIIGDHTCTSKDFVISEYIDNTQVKWETIPVSDNFKWRRARINLHGKVLNVWDADPFTNEIKDDYQAIADKIRMADAWIWLQPDNEPIFNDYLECFIDDYINKPYNGNIYKRCMSVSIPGNPKFDRLAGANKMLYDPETPPEVKNMYSQAIGGEYMGLMFIMEFDCRFYDYYEEEMVKRVLFRLLLSSSSNG